MNDIILEKLISNKYFNKQTKTSNIWGIKNNNKGTKLQQNCII